MPGTPIRIEAENMVLNGYRLESSSSFNFASGKAYTSLFAQGDQETATASTQFNGPSGKYNIVVAYFDENDGVSSFKLEREGSRIGQWRARRTTGGSLPSAQSLVRRTFSDISLNTGDILQLTGTEDLDEAARIDYIELIPQETTPPNPPDEPPTIPTPPPTSGETIRVEAEDMDLDGYRLEQGNGLDFASGKAYTSLFAEGANETAKATTQFGGATGTYDIVVAYFDESDGISEFSLKRGNQQIGQWRADRTTGGTLPSAQSLVQRTFSNIDLTNGDRIELIGTEDLDEAARIDYIEFVPKATTPTQPSGPLSGNNGILEIMALGDSITRGEDAQTATSLQNGYRDDLASKLNGAGIGFDFVGSLKNGSGFDNDHEGRAGWKIDQLTASIGGWLQSYKPEVILLQAGTNDLGFSTVSVSDILGKLDSLIESIVSKRPAAQLFVSSVTPTNPARFSNNDIVSGFQARVTEFNSRLPNLLNGKGSRVKFVNAGGSIDANQDISSDGFHPDDSGYVKIANAFFGAVKSVAGGSDNPTDPDSPDSPDIATGFTSRNGNRLKGSKGVDTITGTSNDEQFRGLVGNDILTGGGGSDVFAFGSLRHGKDTITDFGQDDVLVISSRSFGGGLRRKTDLKTSASSTGVLVSDRNPLSLGQSANFLYNESTQTLSFDRDGIGSQYSAVDIAKLNGVSSLSTDQIVIV